MKVDPITYVDVTGLNDAWTMPAISSDNAHGPIADDSHCFASDNMHDLRTPDDAWDNFWEMPMFSFAPAFGQQLGWCMYLLEKRCAEAVE